MNKAAASTALPDPSLKRRHSRALPPVPFRAFIAYADVAAAGRAMNAINEVFRAAPRKHTLNPMLWRFDQLVSAQWRHRALGEAAEAEIVIFTSTPATSFPLALEEWTSTMLERRQGLSTTLVSLLGPGDTWTVTLEQPHRATLPIRRPVRLDRRFRA